MVKGPNLIQEPRQGFGVGRQLERQRLRRVGARLRAFHRIIVQKNNALQSHVQLPRQGPEIL